MTFKTLHQQAHPLLIGNVWDVPSTKAAEKLGLQALGTSSAAISKLLGYNDGEGISFDELEYMVKRIAHNTNLPLSVDLESGYSQNPQEIADYIQKLSDLGIVGINIEDSIVKKERELLTAETFAKKLSEIKSTLERKNIEMFINVRTDTFLLNTASTLSETLRRVKLYESAGADGIFTPCIENESDIQTVVDGTRLPVNVMCMPNLPDFDSLNKLGVKRISMGNFLFEAMYNQFEETLSEVIDKKSFKPIFN